MEFDNIEPVITVEEFNPLEDPTRPIADDYQKVKWYLIVMLIFSFVNFCLSVYYTYYHTIMSFFGHRKLWKSIVFETRKKKKMI